MTNKKKPLREKGKLRFSRAFQSLKEGDCVTVDIERAQHFSFPERLQGRTGKILGLRGTSYEVAIRDISKPKKYLINPVHLIKQK